MEGLLTLLLFAGLFYFMMRFGCGAHAVHGHGSGGHSGHGSHPWARRSKNDPIAARKADHLRA